MRRECPHDKSIIGDLPDDVCRRSPIFLRGFRAIRLIQLGRLTGASIRNIPNFGRG